MYLIGAQHVQKIHNLLCCIYRKLIAFLYPVYEVRWDLWIDGQVAKDGAAGLFWNLKTLSRGESKMRIIHPQMAPLIWSRECMFLTPIHLNRLVNDIRLIQKQYDNQRYFSVCLLILPCLRVPEA